MKTNKLSRQTQLLISIGLLMVTMPMLLKEYLPLSDFFRGLLAGVGLALEVAGLIQMRKARKVEERLLN